MESSFLAAKLISSAGCELGQTTATPGLTQGLLPPSSPAPPILSHSPSPPTENRRSPLHRAPASGMASMRLHTTGFSKAMACRRFRPFSPASTSEASVRGGCWDLWKGPEMDKQMWLVLFEGLDAMFVVGPMRSIPAVSTKQ